MDEATKRFQVLQQERLYVQKKTFTKWCNSFLEKVHLQINDLFTDLSDGKTLMKLLEILSGENVGRPYGGNLRVYKMENVSLCLQFLSTKVIFENIGTADIVDGNSRLILGLIWTIILRFHIENIVIKVDELESSEKRSAKDALLLWCQKKTEGYKGVKIENFTTSWRNGLGFNALILAHCPELTDFDRLNPADHIGNLNNAFSLAEDQLGIARLLDAKDVDVQTPDDKSIMTYVAAYYHHFAKMKSEVTGTKRIVKDKEKEHKKLLDDPEELYRFTKGAKDLENYMNEIKLKLKGKELPHDVAEAEALLKQHGELHDDILANRDRLDKMIALAEAILAKDPNHKEVRARLNQLKAERDLLDQLWNKKHKELQAAKDLQLLLREADQIDSITTSHDAFLDFKDLGSTADHADTLLKRHIDFENSLKTQEERMRALDELADRMLREGHPDAHIIDARHKATREKMENAKKKCQERHHQLIRFQELQEFKRDAEELSDWIKEKYRMACDESYRDLTNLLPKLQKHQDLEAELKSNKNRLNDINNTGNKMLIGGHYAAPQIKERLTSLNEEWKLLDDKCKDKGVQLRQFAKQELEGIN